MQIQTSRADVVESIYHICLRVRQYSISLKLNHRTALAYVYKSVISLFGIFDQREVFEAHSLEMASVIAVCVFILGTCMGTSGKTLFYFLLYL